jgi:succinate dehydrogenase / fumarate reductase iron-sulfur subunit
MSKRMVQFSIYRYDPDKDDAPYMQDISVEIEPTDRKLLDALTKLKAKDDTISYRRSCREGVCGSDAMNINGKNGLACLTDIDSLKQPIVLRPLPGLPVIRDHSLRSTKGQASLGSLAGFRHADTKYLSMTAL